VIKFLLYALRWQLSTPILWPVVHFWPGRQEMSAGPMADLVPVAVANLVGACIFFWVDRFIFRSKAVESWEFLARGTCHDCGRADYVRRLVLAPGYDREHDPQPQYRCQACSERKLEELERKGIRTLRR